MTSALSRRVARIEGRTARPTTSHQEILRRLSDDDLDFMITCLESGWVRDEVPEDHRARLSALEALFANAGPPGGEHLTDAQLDAELAALGVVITSAVAMTAPLPPMEKPHGSDHSR